MQEVIQKITKVTVAFVLILLLVGCGEVAGSRQDPTATLPIIDPEISIEETELFGIGVGNVIITTQFETEEKTEKTEEETSEISEKTEEETEETSEIS